MSRSPAAARAPNTGSLTQQPSGAAPATASPAPLPAQVQRAAERSLELRIALTIIALTIATLLLDEPLYRWADALPDERRKALGALTVVGSSTRYFVILALVLGAALALRPYLDRRNRARATHVIHLAGFVTASLALSGLLVNLIKLLIGRARPKLYAEFGPLARQPFAFESDFASFPSGHSTTVFALALSLGLIWPRLRWPLLLLAGYLAFTRVVIRAHYLSDTIAGAILALAVTLWLYNLAADHGIGFTRCAGRIRPRRLWPR